MLSKNSDQTGRRPGPPAEQIAALFDRYKSALIGLATLGVVVVAAQLLFAEQNVLLVLQLIVAILLWCVLFFQDRLSTRLLVTVGYASIFAFVVTGATNIGLAEPSIFVLTALIVTSTVLWGLEAGLVTLGVVLVVLTGLAARFLLFPGPEFDLTDFLASPKRWAIFLVSIVVTAIWCILIVDTQRRYWVSSMKNLAAEVQERRETEEQLRVNEERFRIMVEHAPEAITMLDAETGHYVDANSSAERLHGFSRQELADGMGPWDVSPEFQANGRSSAEVAKENLAKANAGEFPRFEWIHLDRQGAPIVCEVQLARLPDPNRKLVRASVFDVTERKRTEAALVEREHDLRQIVEGSIQGILIISPDRRPIFVNDELVRIFGYDSKEEMLALESTKVLIAPDELQRLDEIRGPFLETPRDPIRYEFDGLKKDGTRITLENVAGSIIWNGQLAVQATMYDITDKAKYEEHVRQSQRMDSIGRLTGGIAHDFNNLLAIIQGNAELLEVQAGEAQEQRQAIIGATSRGADLTRRLLTYASQREMSETSVDLGRAIGEMTSILARTLGPNIRIERVIPDRLWLAATDENQFKDALLNLAINARDAMPNGGELTFRCENVVDDRSQEPSSPSAINNASSGECVAVSVTDTGDGIDEADLERVFEPFYTTKSVGAGTGLGLSMVYGFAKQSGGYVTLESEVGKGTSVRMFLPRSRVKVRENAGTSNEVTHAGQGQTVLVVEDDPEVQKMTVRMLEDLGYQVITADRVDTAQEMLDTAGTIHLVLSDVVLPGGISGVEFAENGQSRYPATSFVLMSGYPADAATLARMDVSKFRYLEKPFHKKQLAEALRSGLDDIANS